MTKGDTALAATAVAFCFSFPQKAGTGHQHLWPGHHLGHGPGPGTAGEGPSPLLGAESLQHRIPELLTSLRPNFVRSPAGENHVHLGAGSTYPTLVSPLGWAGRWRRSADPAAADAYRAAPAVRRGLRSPRQLSADPAAGHLFVQPYHPGQAANHTKWRQLPWRRLLHPPQQQRLQSRREPRKILM